MSRVFLILFCFVSCTVGIAFGGDDEFIPPEPRDGSHLQISMVTVGLGDDLYTRYGHVGLRVQDYDNHLDYMVNWGIFSFEDPLFLVRFFRGILNYRMGFEGFRGNIRFYRDVEHRSMREDVIRLTSRQKMALLKKIIWNAQPENIVYPYQYFRHNCATIPRDYLDEVVGGGLKPSLVTQVTTMTYRDYVMKNLSINPFVAWFLDITFNQDNDHPLTAWEEMFYPAKLREHLATMPAFDDDGHPIPGSKLLVDGNVLVDIQDAFPDMISGYWIAVIIVGVPLLVLILSSQPWAKAWDDLQFTHGWQWRLFGWASVFWSFAAGIFGATHVFGWLWSAHTDFHHNINLLLFWPWDAFFIVSGIRWLLKGKFAARSKKWQMVVRAHAWSHVVLVGVYVIMVSLGLVTQNVSRVMTFMVPLVLLYNGLMLLSVERRTT